MRATRLDGEGGLEVAFKRERATPGTVVFAEQIPAGAEAVVGKLYVRKAWCARLGDPTELTVTLTPKR